jgi:hypothetical protein
MSGSLFISRPVRLNLILLLSALLSALGGTAGARPPLAPAALSSSVAGAVTATASARLRVASRPAQSIAGPANSIVVALSAFALTDIVPAFASRRRE